MSKAKAAKGNKGGSGKAVGARPGKPAAASDVKRKRGRPPRAQSDATQQKFPGERMIHRYGNRRFYDLAQSRAVTMEQIGDLVRDKQNVRILDVESGNADITRRVMLHILTDSAQLDAVPVEFLRKLIVPFDKHTATWVHNYLTKGLDSLERAERQGKVPDGDAPSGKGVVEYVPQADYRQQLAKADITRKIDELRRKLEDI